ncbi:hypothetical protein GCM10023081_46840 [Arthrobacter ginkgonis]|uniref:Minor capsid protein n=1 Tax=Arthrobacter ginkgonis TaxID=1630594 RepID=A0ABP7DIY7_9MICC
MAIRPDDAAILAKDMRELFAEAEALLLQKLAAALAKGVDKPEWAEQKLLATQVMLRSLDGVLEDLARGVPGAAARAVAMAYNRGVATAGTDLTSAGMAFGAFDGTPNTGAVAAITQDVVGRLDPMRFQIKRAIADLYQQVVTQTAAQVTTGVLTRREASRMVLNRLAKQGITGFVDKSGRRWEMGAYAEQAVRTASMNASLQGHVDKMYDLGVDTMIVSDAPEECKICRPWEGRVLSISGHTRGTLKDGRVVKGSLAEAKGDGLFHNNCRHSLSIYLPGITKGPGRDTADPAGQELRDQQRGYERAVREGKRKLIIAEQIGGKQSDGYRQERQKLTSLQAEFKDWRDANDRKDLGYRTNLRAR